MFKPFKLNAIHGIVGLGSLGLALLFSVLGGIALNERETLWTLQIAKQHELQRLTLYNSQHELEHQAQALTGGTPADRQHLNAIRDQLYTRLAPRWRNLQGIRPFNLLIHLASSAEVLLRVHEPQSFADFPSAQRPMLLA